VYGFKIAFAKNRRFSFVGWLIQLVESLNILVREKRFYWLPFYHVSFYVESIDLWFDADGVKVRSLTNKEFQKKYQTVKLYDFEYLVPHDCKQWLLDQNGRVYSYRAILVILRKIIRGWFGREVDPIIDQDSRFICTELVLKAMEKCGFVLTTDEIEISTIYETQKTIELERLKHGLFN
jgi:hypothetical protein